MLPAKYLPNQPGGSGKKVIWMVFTIYGHGGHLELPIITHFNLILYIHHINAQCEISLKLAQYFPRKCHLKFFMNGCHGNQSCHAIFIKASLYEIRTLSLIFLWKISFLAQRVHVSEILRHFSKLYPTHSRLVYDPTGTILAILYSEVSHMLPAKYQPNRLGGSGEEDFWMVFTIYGHGGHLEFQIMTHFCLILYIHHINAKYETSLKLAQYFPRKCHLKFFMNGCHGNQSCHAIFIKTSYM